MRPRAIFSFVLVSSFLLASCSGPDPSDRGHVARVALRTFQFEPQELKIPLGTAVIWTNQDDILHTVTSGKGQEQGVPGVSNDRPASPSGLFDAELDGVDARFTVTFEDEGTYSYFCSIHPGMAGRIVVR